MGFCLVCLALVVSGLICSALLALPWFLISSLPHGPGPPSLPQFHFRSTALLHCSEFGVSGSRSLGEGGLCHESCPCTPGYSPPEVTRSPHGLLHHTNGCTSPKTTFPIINCTDDTQLITLITQLITNHTAYINHGHPLPLCRVLHGVYPSDSYSTEPSILL